MSVKVSIIYTDADAEVEFSEFSGLHASLGHIEDRFVQAKEGGPIVAEVVITTDPDNRL